MDKPIADFLANRDPLATERTVWSYGRYTLQLTAYLTADLPPHDYILSARSIVFRQREILVVADPDTVHIIPGGRVEPGETLWQTVCREVAEESGWRIANGRPFAVLHYHNLSPQPDPPFRLYPHFLQVVYISQATHHAPHLREENGYELWAKFYPPDKAEELITSPLQRALLQNAITFGVQ